MTMTIARPLQAGVCCRRTSRSAFAVGFGNGNGNSVWRARVPRISMPATVIGAQFQARNFGLKSSLSSKGGVWSSSPRGDISVSTLKLPRHSWIIPYSTSQQPDEPSKIPSPENTQPKVVKKPLLKVLAQLTPHENIYTIPNILTFSRLIAAPVVGYLVLHDHHAWAVGLFAYAGITDLVDGWIARRWNLQTVVGTVIDPMADKTLMTILTVCLAIKGALPVWLAFIILGRDIGLAITAIYYRWISLPPPKTFSRYWDFSLPSAEVHPTTISKYNTALQLALIGATTAMPLVTVDVAAAMTAMQYLVATTTVWSGASYIYTKDAVKILNQDGKMTNVKDVKVTGKEAGK